LLGQLGDQRSAALLVEALRVGSFARSRIAASLEAFPLEVGDRIAPLLATDDAQVRFWATTLMRRYPKTFDLTLQLVVLTRDPAPAVRKAAIDSIVATSTTLEASHALRDRLADETPFVRAHAARALGRLQGASQAAALARLLADRDWTVRNAAKETLTMMGEASSPAVFPFLSHSDGFARNGAAEVLQNLGIFERLVALEATGPSDPARARAIRLLASAGGARMWESVVQRLNVDIRVRARQLLAPQDRDGPLVDEVA
jgi:HEAT repeat protein